MGKGHSDGITEFTLSGRFLGFLLEDGYKLKWMQLATAAGEQTIKLTKESRAGLITQGGILKLGDWIQVWGEQKLDADTGTLKLKAYRITPTSPAQLAFADTPEISQVAVSAAAKPATILVCQKSDCQRQGGRQLCQALAAAVKDSGLEGQVNIKGTGCMKHCKAGPNLVFMPDKARYSRVHPSQIPGLVKKHLLTQ
ncbi:hypothetical protein BST81_02630 [Leptolyngbya sp. 'hensonii']|uniref:(2Fe-2S) ferredoxin domain-containing protein n=1 Tax=Leptolyngbya sp. 'hensonii' TaxID=1922337 RepID=UPI000950158D|nr:(2Fe-2S) ferredoxin domain-containing protein [Leptolyngbya sp. 'hensonii']OLP19987.1 hypothetical protein BST81_02630 [Leptolyngbya sp. 'hensonii']